MSDYAVMPIIDYIRTCSTIRGKSGYNKIIKSGELPEKITGVYEAGQNAEWSEFWNAFQANGSRTNYQYAFYRTYWNDKNFKPKYDIVCKGNATSVFHLCGVTDLATILKECGVTLDTSGATNVSNFLYGSSITHLPALDLTGISKLDSFAASSSDLHTIDKIILKNDGSQTFTSNPFYQCPNLANFVIEGVIGTSFYIQYCNKLTPETMKSIILHLANYKGTDNEGVYSVKFASTCWTALEADSKAPNGGTWKEYVQTTLGWTT